MPAEMSGEHVVVTSRVNGRTEKGIKLHCTYCSADVFHAILIGPNKDLHLHCAVCEESHCAHGSQCQREEER